jgi:hypothetical protein
MGSMSWRGAFLYLAVAGTLYLQGAPSWVIVLVCVPTYLGFEWLVEKRREQEAAAAQEREKPQKIAEQRRQMDAAVERARAARKDRSRPGEHIAD